MPKFGRIFNVKIESVNLYFGSVLLQNPVAEIVLAKECFLCSAFP